MTNMYIISVYINTNILLHSILFMFKHNYFKCCLHLSFIFKDSFLNDFIAYRRPKSQTLPSTATSVTFYYIGVSVARGEGQDTQVLSDVTGGFSSNDLSYTFGTAGNSFNNNKNKNIILRLGQNGVPNEASDVTVRYTISIRGKTYATN